MTYRAFQKRTNGLYRCFDFLAAFLEFIDGCGWDNLCAEITNQTPNAQQAEATPPTQTRDLRPVLSSWLQLESGVIFTDP